LSRIFLHKTSNVQSMTRDGTAASAVDHSLVRSWIHDGAILGAQFSRDEARVLTWSGDKTVRLWEVSKAESLQTFKHDGYVIGAQFSRDEARVLTWSQDKTARLWDSTDPLAALTPAERILELEVRSGATLNEQLNLRTLKFDEWQTKVKSTEYRTIQEKLAPARLDRKQ